MATPQFVLDRQEALWQKIERRYMLPVDKLTLAVVLVDNPREIIIFPVKFYSNQNKTSLCLIHYAEQYGGAVGIPVEDKIDIGIRIALHYHRKRANEAIVRIERRPPQFHFKYCWICKRLHKMSARSFEERFNGR